jgi:Ni2+-binding GTPase involved in maturation of urease and hydrogenase
MLFRFLRESYVNFYVIVNTPLKTTIIQTNYIIHSLQNHHAVCCIFYDMYLKVDNEILYTMYTVSRIQLIQYLCGFK